MTRNQYLLTEKFAVYAVAAVLAMVMYFGFAPQILPADPTGPISSMATGQYLSAAMLVAVFVIAGVAICLGSTFVRAGSFALVLLAGMAGVSMKSGMFRVLVWQEGTSPGVWVCMLVELLVLAAAMGLVDFVAGLIRWKKAGRRGVFVSLSEMLTDEQLASLAEEKLVLPERQLVWSREILPDMAGHNYILALLMLLKGQGKLESRHKTLATMALKNAAGFMFVGIVVGLVAAYVLAGSAARGQLVFAAFGAFWIATAAAYYMYPVPDNFAAWALPVIVGVIYYVIAMFTSSGLNPNQWEKLQNVFQILPVDWIFAGGAGAMFGLWSADRSKEARILEKLGIEVEK